jgi:HEAT repeat protein
MERECPKRSGLAGGVADVLNAGGRAVVYVYDMGSKSLGGLVSLVKKMPRLPGKATGMFTAGLGFVKPGEANGIEEKIKEYEGKIQRLYYEIGKEGAKYSDAEGPLEADAVKKLIADVRDYEKEIQRLKDRIAEMEAQRKEAAVKNKKREKEIEEKEKTDERQVVKAVESAIQKSVKHGAFETASERAIFDKVANDLLDSEMEIKILAAAELGKIGNEAAVHILMEAVKYGDPSLTSEILNSLINIGDSQAIPLFKAKINDSKHRVRIGCLRGLYKLAEDADAMPFLVDALRDEHPEVRRTAATFIGWKDYADAVPALAQCLKDEDERVRKAAVSSLANIKDESSVLSLIKVLADKDLEIREKALDAIRMITGEEIAFDLNASGKALTAAIDALKEWWQERRLGKSDFSETEEPVAYELQPEADSVEVAAAEEDVPAREEVEFAATEEVLEVVALDEEIAAVEVAVEDVPAREEVEVAAAEEVLEAVAFDEEVAAVEVAAAEEVFEHAAFDEAPEPEVAMAEPEETGEVVPVDLLTGEGEVQEEAYGAFVEVLTEPEAAAEPAQPTEEPEGTGEFIPPEAEASLFMGEEHSIEHEQDSKGDVKKKKGRRHS